MANKKRYSGIGLRWGLFAAVLSLSGILGAEVLAVLAKNADAKVLAVIDPVTGTCFPRGDEVPIGLFSGGTAALDLSGSTLYFSGSAPGESARRLVGIEAASGKVLTAPLIAAPAGVRPVPAFLVVSPGVPVVLMDRSPTSKALFRVDGITGAVRQIGGAMTIAGYSGGVAVHDPKTNVLYFAARAEAGGPWRLFAFNMILGSLIGNPVISPPAGYRNAPALLLNGEGAGILALLEHGSLPQMQLVRIDPLSGACLAVGNGLPAEGFSSGVAAFDPDASLIYFPANAPGESLRRLFTIDAATGAVLRDPVLSAPPGTGTTPIALVHRSAPPPAGPPGRVPDGILPGVPLTVAKDPGVPGGLRLSWGGACLPGGTDYAVHAGALGSYYSHAGALCTTWGALTATISGGSGNRYFLVVPLSVGEEGSYGTDSLMVERPAGSNPCRPTQVISTCP